METISSPVCHHNGFVTTHALGHMMYGYTLLVGTSEPKSAQQAKQGA